MRILGSITNRIFLASALLAMLSIAAAVYFVSARLTQQTEAELQRDLDEAVTFVADQRRTRVEYVTRMARLIADLPKFKAVVELADPATAEGPAREYREQAGADQVVVTDRRGGVIARTGDVVVMPSWRSTDAAAPSLDGAAPAAEFLAHPRGVMEVISVPVAMGLDDPYVMGGLSIGSLLDDGRAAQIKALTGADIAFAMGGTVRASTLGVASQAALAPLLSSTRPTRVVIGGEEYVAVRQPLGPDAAAEAPAAIILRSRTERLRTLASIQAALAAIALVATVLAIGVSYGVARTITRPLASITDHMRQLTATGDLTRKIATPGPSGWQDDDARMLATTFNSLTDAIVRFQREAAQRERLSSLGRLSTVIAHEVRNPLMIIKGALRTLARPGASADDVRDAAKDIDGEIGRLNSLVNDVLDVARPIRFDPAPTDVNAVCRAAVQAAGAGQPAVRVIQDLSPALPPLVTDSERLRLVLVNLLTNAFHASDGRAGAAVTVSTRPAGDRRVAIAVRDAGHGIAEDDLPRIFDPYFTTRRAGTGLGLAIAKNVVEGLGGSIGVESRPGSGAEFRIELGDAPAKADA